jgi:general secretion pathway protein K
MPVVTVLWALGLLSAVALSLLWDSNAAYSLAHNRLAAAEIAAMVEAGVNRAVAGLLDPSATPRWRIDGVPRSLAFEGADIRVSIQDEFGKIDLNQADVTLLASLLRTASLDPKSASDLADKIVDWRTAAPLKHLNGAKEQDYQAAGKAYRPRNGPFQSVDELLLVMDMTPVIFRCIEPALTVYSGHQYLDPTTAPREALRALPNMTPESVEALLATRLSAPPAFDASTPGGLTSLRGRAFTIRTEFEKSDRMITQEVTVRLTENPRQPFWLLRWRAL